MIEETEKLDQVWDSTHSIIKKVASEILGFKEKKKLGINGLMKAARR